MKKVSVFLLALACAGNVFAQSETKTKEKGPHGAKMESKKEHKGGKGHHKKVKTETKSAM